MTTLVAEESVARLVAGARGERLVVVPRARRRARGWRGLDIDRVVEALETGGPAALVLARDPSADPGAGVLGELARIMGHEVVRLPEAADEAAWAIGVAAHGDFQGDGLLRRLEALVGEMREGGPLPRRALGSGPSQVPSLRPAVLAKWAGCSWRACGRCAGGGPAAGRCARCRAPLTGEGS
jgi:hypothetical protein